MKIALVLERFDPHQGGLEHWTWQFAQQLVARENEVHVVAFEFHPSARETGVVQHCLTMPKSRLARAAALECELRKDRFNVIHDMGCGWHADIFHPHSGSTQALWEQNLLRIPRWRQIRFWRERRYRETQEIERRQHARGDTLIVAVSEMVRRQFETMHGVQSARLRLIYNGVDATRFSPAHRATHRDATRRQLGVKDETLFLLLAHNLLLKNARALIEAAG